MDVALDFGMLNEGKTASLNTLRACRIEETIASLRARRVPPTHLIRQNPIS